MLKNLILTALIIIVIAISIVFVWQLLNRHRYHFTEIEKNTAETEELKDNICAFMEERVDGNAIGKDNYHCVVRLYGYDNTYAYAWVCCQGFVGRNPAAFSRGTGFGIPMRIEYAKPHYKIIRVEQPRDGDVYDNDIRKLFPRVIYNRYLLHLNLNYPDSEDEDLKREIETKAGVRY